MNEWQQLTLSQHGMQIDAPLAPYVQVIEGGLQVHVPQDQALKLLLTNAAAQFVLQIQLDQGASLEYSLLTVDPLAQSLQINVHSQDNASLTGEHALLTEAEYREELKVYLQGRAAKMHIRGLQYGRQRARVAHQLSVYHEADDTVSDIEFRGVADGQSRVIFSGLIHVPKHVKGVDANEQTRNILLSNRAEIEAHPELEIYSNEIACRHGASIGNLDQNALFYLQSRGFSESEARLMLVSAFTQDILKMPLAALVQHNLGQKHDH